MTVKRKQIAAKAINATSSGAGVLVFASTDTEMLSAADSMKQILSSNLTSFGCKSCGIHLTASADAKPFCVHCGSEEVEPLGEDVSLDLPEDMPETEVSAITCSSCGVHNVISAKLVTACNGAIHCSSCGTSLKVKADADGAPVEETPVVEDSETEDLVTEDDMTADSDDVGDLVVDSDEDFEDDSSDEGEDLTAHPSMVVPEITDLADESTQVTEEGLPQFLADEIANEIPEVPTTTFEMSSSDQAFDLLDDQDGEQLADSLELDDTDEGFCTASINNRLVAFKGHVAVASLSAKVAGDRAEVMHSAGFQKAVQIAVKAKGLRAGLKAFSFVSIKVPVVSQATVTAKVTAAKADADTNLKASLAVLQESMAIAAAGLARGRWKGTENALRASVETELTRLGARNPTKIAATIFSQSSVQYSKTLLEVAAKISKYSKASRRELAEMLELVEDTGTTPMPSVDTDSVSPEENFPVEFEARLNTTAAILRPKAISAAATASAVDMASAILAGKAKLQFD